MNEDRHGKVLLYLIGIIFVFSAIWVSYTSQGADVSVLVRGVDGERAVYSLSVPDGELRPQAGEGADDEIAQEFALSDGSQLSIGTAGIVSEAPGSRAFRVLVASPVAATARTPLAVWGDGARIAWVNPADTSLQVYARTERGTYTPVYVNQDLRPNSLQFTKDGSSLVVAKILGGNTDVFDIMLESGAIERITTIEGLATLLP